MKPNSRSLESLNLKNTPGRWKSSANRTSDPTKGKPHSTVLIREKQQDKQMFLSLGRSRAARALQTSPLVHIPQNPINLPVSWWLIGFYPHAQFVLSFLPGKVYASRVRSWLLCGWLESHQSLAGLSASYWTESQQGHWAQGTLLLTFPLASATPEFPAVIPGPAGIFQYFDNNKASFYSDQKAKLACAQTEVLMRTLDGHWIQLWITLFSSILQRSQMVRPSKSLIFF